MPAQVIQTNDQVSFSLTLQNDATDRFFWLQDKLSGIVYFEAMGQVSVGAKFRIELEVI